MQKKSIIVLSLDAGGTNFVFTARKDGCIFGNRLHKPATVQQLDECIESIISGFKELSDSLSEKPDAISFAFPGPADYRNGIIGDLPNLPAFRGGVPLAAILEEEFGIPVFINNDGDLFAMGESKNGFLSKINQMLADSGSNKRYNNLIGITLGTGFGVGITINGQLLEGDNSAAAEGWLIRNKQYNYSSIEDTISIRSIKRMYAEQIHIDPAKSPEPEDIYKIAIGEKDGVYVAALESFLRYGEALGDAIATIVTLIDGVVVIGGGISGAYSIFSRTMMSELNGFFTGLNGVKHKRLIQQLYNVEDSYSMKQFLFSNYKELEIPRSSKTISYQEEKKIPIGLSSLGASEAIAIGAYYFAFDKLNQMD